MSKQTSKIDIKLAEAIHEKEVTDVALSEDKATIITKFADGSEHKMSSGRGVKSA